MKGPMNSTKRATSLFDDIFQLQTTVPDIDPEDPEDGFKSSLTEGATEAEALGSTQLRKQTAIIPDDPKYRGKKISRKNLYSDDEEEESDVSPADDTFGSDGAGSESYNEDEENDDVDDEDDDDDSDDDDDDEEKDMSYDNGDMSEDAEEEEEDETKKKGAVVLTPSDSDDKEKGKAVSYQLGLWDDLIKCRISLQKLIASCNRLPVPGLWERFTAVESFKKESSDAHRSMHQIVSSLLDLQQCLSDKTSKPKQGQATLEDGDEEITSESEIEDDDEKSSKTDGKKEEEEGSVDDDEDDDDGEGSSKGKEDGEEMDFGDKDDEGESDDKDSSPPQRKRKRKLSSKKMEEMVSKRHKDFQSFRNNTLEKWDEKTRLSLAKIKSKNFAAFDISVLKQIQQVLVNKERLTRRIHQNRSAIRVLGQEEQENDQVPQEMVLEDDEDEVEVKQRSSRPDIDINPEIVDDSDFYQMCLRDFIQLKQNEETDPVLANKHWLEIQSLRRKHKRKVDTRASKGRKIRYHVKEKLKNFMGAYDKSTWSEEQKDDLFKALFGGRQEEEDTESHKPEEKEEAPTIKIGL